MERIVTPLEERILADLRCFSCGVHYSPERASETCDMAHRETWGHEWVSGRVCKLTDMIVKLNNE